MEELLFDNTKMILEKCTDVWKYQESNIEAMHTEHTQKIHVIKVYMTAWIVSILRLVCAKKNTDAIQYPYGMWIA